MELPPSNADSSDNENFPPDICCNPAGRLIIRATEWVALKTLIIQSGSVKNSTEIPSFKKSA
jgi:hypothetical protein